MDLDSHHPQSSLPLWRVYFSYNFLENMMKIGVCQIAIQTVPYWCSGLTPHLSPGLGATPAFISLMFFGWRTKRKSSYRAIKRALLKRSLSCTSAWVCLQVYHMPRKRLRLPSQILLYISHSAIVYGCLCLSSCLKPHVSHTALLCCYFISFMIQEFLVICTGNNLLNRTVKFLLCKSHQQKYESSLPGQ